MTSSKDQADYAEWVGIISPDVEKKSACEDARDIMSHQASIEHQQKCEGGEMAKMMVQTFFYADESICIILGTAVDPDSHPIRHYLIGTRPGTRPMIRASVDEEGFAPGVARDRRCSSEIYRLGSIENNIQFISARIGGACYQDKRQLEVVNELATILTPRRRLFHETMCEVETTCCLEVIIKNQRILLATLTLELMADSNTLWI